MQGLLEKDGTRDQQRSHAQQAYEHRHQTARHDNHRYSQNQGESGQPGLGRMVKTRAIARPIGMWKVKGQVTTTYGQEQQQKKDQQKARGPDARVARRLSSGLCVRGRLPRIRSRRLTAPGRSRAVHRYSAENQRFMRRVLSRRRLDWLRGWPGRLHVLRGYRGGNSGRGYSRNMPAAILLPHLSTDTRQLLFHLLGACRSLLFIKREQAHYQLLQCRGYLGIKLAHWSKSKAVCRVIGIAVGQAAMQSRAKGIEI